MWESRLLGRRAGLVYLALVVVAAVVLVIVLVLSKRHKLEGGGPITITSGGTYTGSWVSNDPNTYAVTIATSQQVTITGSTIKGVTRLVGNSVDHVKLTATNNSFYGLYPGGNGISGDRAIYLTGFDSADIEHNYVEQKGGFKLGNWSGVAVAHPVIVKYNRANNIDGRRTDGAGGYQRTYYPSQMPSFLQLAQVNNAPGIEVAWNEIHNDPFNSGVEDNINMCSSSGTADSPIDIHDNFIDGAYPPDPAHAPAFNGGGILLGDCDGANTSSHLGGNYEIARDNQVIRTTNYGIGIVGGGGAKGSANLTLHHNRAITSGLLPDGTPIPSVNSGMVVWSNPHGILVNASAHDNLVGWWLASRGVRGDWWIPDCTGNCTNTPLRTESSKALWVGESKEPITQADEANEISLWNQKVAANAVTIGLR